ncbi:MAG: signal peptidase I [Actinomycetota bacterium]|nr:signal peptidase I [Actinomycetota bacterium]
MGDSGAGPDQLAAPRRQRRKLPLWQELPLLVVAALAIALLLKTFLVQAFYIPSESMLPTLEKGDRVLVEKISYRIGDPGRGDIVVFDNAFQNEEPAAEDERSVVTRIGDSFKALFGLPTEGHSDIIKRVVAVGGDRVEGRDGEVLVNGERVDEPYLAEEVGTADFSPITVPDDAVWVMGDNRGSSGDSRSFGPVPVDAIVGKAFLLVWPPGNLGAI